MKAIDLLAVLLNVDPDTFVMVLRKYGTESGFNVESDTRNNTLTITQTVETA